MLLIHDSALEGCFSPGAEFESALRLQGEVHRALEQRRTLAFTFGGRDYFIKLHFPPSWREIAKNLVQLRLPVIGARNEWRALERLRNAGVRTARPCAYFDRGGWLGRRRSFIVLGAVENFIDLESFWREQGWQSIPFPARRAIIREVAETARRMHDAGVNHRDFYLCHFLLDRRFLEGSRSEPVITLIDLHRARIARRLPRRWRAKDLGALYFSAMDCGLTRSDLFYFVRHYTGRDAAPALRADPALWRVVIARAEGIRRRNERHGYDPHLG